MASSERVHASVVSGREDKTLEMPTRQAWRDWLQAHNESVSEVWLVFHKRHTGLERISYDDAVEEALCFGWIDSLIRRLDDERYARKFTPRKPDSRWSAANRKRYARMADRGLLAAAGRARAPKNRSAAASSGAKLPPYVEKALKDNGAAWTRFEQLAPSRQRAYAVWLAEPKREETKAKRLQEMIRLLTAAKLPRYIERELKASPRAWAYFERLAPSYRQAYIGWIDSAKRPETKARRLREAVGLLESGRKLGLK